MWMILQMVAIVAWQPAHPITSPQTVTIPRRAVPTLAFNDAAVVVVAGSLLAAAGYLQYSVSAGKKGLNAFLLKEKEQNPFYKDNFKADTPKGASWFNIRLPNLPYVEVYGQSEPTERLMRRRSSRSQLYAELDDAIEREDYSRAAEVKRKIDDSYTS
mgnify:CR=1 FL=1